MGPSGPPCPAPQSAGRRWSPPPWPLALAPSTRGWVRNEGELGLHPQRRVRDLSPELPGAPSPAPAPPPPCLGPARAASALWWRRGRPGGAGSGRAQAPLAAGAEHGGRWPPGPAVRSGSATGTHSGRVTAAGRSAHPTGGRGVGAGAGLGAREAREPQGSQACSGTAARSCPGELRGDQGPTPPWAGVLAPRVAGQPGGSGGTEPARPAAAARRGRGAWRSPALRTPTRVRAEGTWVPPGTGPAPLAPRPERGLLVTPALMAESIPHVTAITTREAPEAPVAPRAQEGHTWTERAARVGPPCEQPLPLSRAEPVPWAAPPRCGAHVGGVARSGRSCRRTEPRGATRRPPPGAGPP